MEVGCSAAACVLRLLSGASDGTKQLQVRLVLRYKLVVFELFTADLIECLRVGVPRCLPPLGMGRKQTWLVAVKWVFYHTRAFPCTTVHPGSYGPCDGSDCSEKLPTAELHSNLAQFSSRQLRYPSCNCVKGRIKPGSSLTI